MKSQNPNWLRTCAWIASGLITASIVILHVVNLRSAGALWRDEAAAVHLAWMPSFAAIWSHLEHESFPLLLTMLLRGWSALGLGESDAGLRAFGLLVGIALLGVLWWNAWQFSSGPPLFSLLLLGLSPTAIRWGDSLRAYGLGTLFLLCTVGLVWNARRAPTWRKTALAMLAGVLAVQALYQNAFFLAAICLSGMALAALRRDGKRILLAGVIGLPAALSLLPYLSVIRRANEWNMTTQVPLDLARIWTVLHRALSEAGPLALWLWCGCLLAALVITVMIIARRRSDEEGDLACFLLVLMISSTLAYYFFLKLAKFPTEVWYYLPWMAIMAVALDALFGRAMKGRGRAVAVFGAMVASGFLVFSAWPRVQTRMTNIVLVAQELNRAAASQDLVLVHPWFCGASFHRYYTGAAPWTTLPPLDDYGLQRLDLLKRQMQLDDPIAPVLEKMENVLRAGGTIWLVGHFPFSNPPQPPPQLPRPGEGPEGWRAAPYMMAYGMQATVFLQRNATQSAPVEIPLEQSVNPFEDLPLRTITGWRQRY